MMATNTNDNKNDDDSNGTMLLAAVEGGGTSFVVAVAQWKVVAAGTATKTKASTPEILFRSEIDSSHDQPEKTLEECVQFFQLHKPKNGYHALGVATFGPVGLDKNRPATYGRILSTSPKRSWRNVDFLSPLVTACRGNHRPLAVRIETDVNAPAFAEYLLEQDKNQHNTISSVAYITVGTGIGVGLVVHGQPVHGRMHPEGGHVLIQPLQENDEFQGYSWGAKCPFHGKNTVEGIASSVALTERLQMITGESNISRSYLSQLDDDDSIWDHAANAIANLCVTLLLVTSVEKIVIGGGIMKRTGLLRKIQQHSIELMNDYVELPKENMSTLITTSSYGDSVGLQGAIMLAQQAYLDETRQSQTTSSKSGTNDAKLSPFAWGFIHGVAACLAAAVLGTALTKGRRV